MESVTAALNQSVAVFEMSPVGTVLEHRVVSWLCELAGSPRERRNDDQRRNRGDVHRAVSPRAAPHCRTRGRRASAADPRVLLCGEHAHYAVTRAGAELGLGMRNVFPVRSRDYKIDPDALRGVARDSRPGTRIMAVVATAGSTATGSFDDLDGHGLGLR